MKIFETTTFAPAETKKIARYLSKRLPRGTYVALTGPLGSGKTTFVAGFSCGLWAPSPTFALQKICASPDGKNRVYHLDLYRLGRKEFIMDILEPVAGDGTWLIEWASRLPENLLPAPRLVDIRFEHAGGDKRKITVSTPSEEIARKFMSSGAMAVPRFSRPPSSSRSRSQARRRAAPSRKK